MKNDAASAATNNLKGSREPAQHAQPHHQREPDRLGFRLKALYEASRELNDATDPRSILEAFLLMTMGTLGASRGFVLFSEQDTPDEKPHEEAVSRGLEAADLSSICEGLRTLERQAWPPASWYDPTCDPSAPVRLVSRDGAIRHPLWPEGVELLIKWSVDEDCSGFLGLGVKLMDRYYNDEDVDLIFSLTGSLITALRDARSRKVVERLHQELQIRRQELEEAGREATRVKRHLDRRVFHLRALYDTTLELSGLTDSRALAESFLLMAMGALSVRQGYVLLISDTRQGAADRKCHLAWRGTDRHQDYTPRDDEAERLAERLERAIQAERLGPLCARRLSSTGSGLLEQTSLPVKARIGVIFAVDDSCRGIIGLGERITEEAFSEEEQELLTTLANNFTVFLKNARSFELISELAGDLERRNAELDNTIRDLTSSRQRVEVLERAKARIKSVIQRESERIGRISAMDFMLIICLGVVLGLLFNLANPGGIHLVPESWLRASAPYVDARQARAHLEEGKAVLVDARPAEFFEQAHASGAVSLPLALFDFVYMMKLSGLDPQREIIVYGRNISRLYDEDVAFKLTSRGHKNVKLLSGDLVALQKEGYPLEP